MGTNASATRYQNFTWPTTTSVGDNMSSSEDPDCAYEMVDFDRFMLIVAFGTPCALVGVLCNLTLCFIFGRRHHLRTSDLYFAVLASLDTAFCVLYIFLMTIDAISLHYGLTWLYAFYTSYSFPLFAIARIIQLAAVYMVVAATVERWFVVRKWSDTWSTNDQGTQLLSPRTRTYVVLIIFATSVCLRSPAFWEYTVEKKSSCDNPFGAYQYVPRLAVLESYRIFNFYFMNCVQVFLPFTLLTILNVSIIRTLRRRLSLAKKFLFPIRYLSEVSFEKGVSREKLKSATYTLVAVVTGYLVSNLFNTIITILEHTVKDELLLDEDHNSRRWYTLSTDISSVLTIVNSCLRLPLYCLCSRAFRREVFAWCTRRREENQFKKDKNGEFPLNSSTHLNGDNNN